MMPLIFTRQDDSAIQGTKQLAHTLGVHKRSIYIDQARDTLHDGPLMVNIVTIVVILQVLKK